MKLAISILMLSLSSTAMAAIDYKCMASVSGHNESSARIHVDGKLLMFTSFDSSGKKVIDSAEFIKSQDFGTSLAYLEQTGLFPSTGPSYMFYDFNAGNYYEQFWIDTYPNGIGGTSIVRQGQYDCRRQ